jgi:pyocin large subunit-like protein
MVQIQVMTITGKVVWTKNQIISTEGFLSKEITWDGKDDFGNKIEREYISTNQQIYLK